MGGPIEAFHSDLVMEGIASNTSHLIQYLQCLSQTYCPLVETTYFELEFSFTDTISFDAIVRSNIVDGDAETSSTKMLRYWP